METKLGWYIKDRVIFHRPVGDQPIEVIQHNNDMLIKLMDKGEAPIHVIVDARYATKLPTSLLKLSNAASFLSHPSLGWLTTISNNPVITFIAGIIPQISSWQLYRVFSDLETSISFLKEKEPQLDWSTTNHQLIEE
ncbi:MAG: hypothetical protein H0X30_05480 [Anaerolineae bacterium]|nr:hypothetical protein [Anaerolineae bacterium]